MRKGKDSVSRNIAGAVWSCQAPFRAPVHAAAGSANTRKWVGGTYIRRPSWGKACRTGFRKGAFEKDGREGLPHSRWRPECPTTRHPSCSGKPRDDEGLPDHLPRLAPVRGVWLRQRLLKTYDRLLWLEWGDGRYRRAAHTEWAANRLASYQRQQITIPSRTSRPRAPGTWAAGNLLRRGRSRG